jgi:hypothetical protein
MKLVNLRNNAVLADKVKVADRPWQRLVGLLNRRSLEKGEALILKPCLSIHTLFMRFSIDVLFLDKDNRVIGILHSFKPFRFSPLYFNAVLAIEFPANTLQFTQTKIGDIIKVFS